jgi:ribose 5-phosphate isomerase RpiB
MENKKVIQISLDIVVGSECNGYELADEVCAELNRRGFTVVAAGFQCDLTEDYMGYQPDLFRR